MFFYFVCFYCGVKKMILGAKSEKETKLDYNLQYLGRVSSPLCVYELGLVCSQTQLCHIGVFNDYIKQLYV